MHFCKCLTEASNRREGGTRSIVGTTRTRANTLARELNVARQLVRGGNIGTRNTARRGGRNEELNLAEDTTGRDERLAVVLEDTRASGRNDVGERRIACNGGVDAERRRSIRAIILIDLGSAVGERDEVTRVCGNLLVGRANR